MDKSKIGNLRFKLINSTLKNHKEVLVTYEYKGEAHNYVVFVKEGKNVNYFNSAKKIFEDDLKSGEVLKTLKRSSGGVARPWLVATAGVLGAAAITFGALFTWKAIATAGFNDKWYLNTRYLDSLTTANIGSINTLEVNGVTHRVRLIGIDHDTLADGSKKKAHTTWEFADVLSDKNGFSLATFWNDTSDADVPCRDYFNSSIRYALVGEQKDSNITVHHGWYEKGSDTKSKTYTKPVIDMLPSDLVKVIKPVEKNVVMYEKVADEPHYYEKHCDDKLFLLSTIEMFGYEPRKYTSTDFKYDYYIDCSGEDSYTPVKRQIKYLETEGAATTATNVTDKQATTDAESIAGYNSTNKSYLEHPGTGYYLRNLSDVDLGQGDKDMPMGVSSWGSYCAGEHGDGNELAAPIAPAFCL